MASYTIVLKKNLALLLLSTIFTLLLCEVIIRLFYPQITEHDTMFEYDSELGWKFIPDKKGIIIYPGEAYHYITTNELGFRDDPLPGKNSGLKKIMVLGDSFVSNISVKDEEVFSEVLESHLSDYAVLNFGVNAYGQVQEYLLQQTWLPAIKPELLLVMIYIKNDFTDNTGEKDWLYSRPFASLSNEGTLQLHSAPEGMKKPSNTKKGLLRNFHLYHFIKTRTQVIRSKFSKQNPSGAQRDFRVSELSFCKTEPSPDIEKKFQIMKKLLLKISDHAKANEVPLVFALAPSIVQVEDKLWQSQVLEKTEEDEKYDRTYPNNVLMKFAAENNLNMIDLLPELRRETKKGKKLYNPQEQHWTADGNKVVANSLLQYLNSGNFIADSSNN